MVLAERPMGESSVVLTAYVRELGLASILAKGAKKPGSPLIALTQPLSLVELILTEGRSFRYLSRGKLLRAHHGIRRDYPRLIAASLLQEVLLKTLQEGWYHPRIYELIKKTLVFLEKEEDPKVFLAAFLIKYISFMGYRPKFAEGADGGFLFPLQGRGPGENCFLTQVEYDTLITLLKGPYEELERLQAPPALIERFIALLTAYIQFHMDCSPIQSLQLF